MITVAELNRRFWSKVYMTDGCWIWTGAKNDRGYGHLAVGRTKFIYAHRLSFDILGDPSGRTPEKTQIDHLCRNPSCVRPDHLELVTPRENVRRGKSPAAVNAGKTHCVKGHPLEGDNLYVRPDGTGWRNCKECKRSYDRAWRARLRGVA